MSVIGPNIKPSKDMPNSIPKLPATLPMKFNGEFEGVSTTVSTSSVDSSKETIVPISEWGMSSTMVADPLNSLKNVI